ncbi:hypothetical protein MO867_21355 [Microbulbifer sp. OS29]|uniref:DUF4386 family protein n=1 Tax=Microbulbifer okhotskensis TaxID=2926617 RepID=A0A9X2ES98_9GAMM|nr:hypothetical protein [Microbulbifer okhotskensis]MCO1336879.1 hypothetical protein [Microbulbifer okhotskensis]
MRQSRILLINILLTGAFYVAGFVALGDSYPTIESSGEEIVDWLSANGTSARLYAWTAAFFSLGLAIFGGQISTLLPHPHRYIFLAGVLGFAITAQVQAWFWAGLAFHPEGLDPAVARTLFGMATYWGPLVNGSTTAMAVAVGALGFGASPIIPRWLTWISAIFFVEQALETITIFGQTGFIAPGGSMNIYLGGLIGFLWVAGVVRWAISRMNESA